MKNGWQIKKLGDVCATIQDGAHESPKQQFNEPAEGRFLYITSKNIRTNFLDLDNVSYVNQDFHDRIYPRCKPRVGDVLLTKDGANTGNVALNTIDKPFSLLSSVCLIKTNADRLKPNFLCYYLQSPIGLKSITGQMTGAAIKRIILRDIKLATIPLPPLPEQKRIVGILDEAFEGIASAKVNAEKNLQNARALFESQLQSIFTQRGKTWTSRRLKEIAEVQSGGTPSVPQKNYWDGNIPWYSSGELNETHTTDPERQITEEGLNASNAKMFPKGSLLVGMYDTAALKMSILDRDGTFNQAIAGVKPNDKIVTEFVLHAINANKPRLLLERRGVRQKNLSLGKIKEIVIPLPDISEQCAVVSRLHCVIAETEHLQSVYQRKLAALEVLKKSLLHQAFSGEL
jgi:type I restriction enzyme S subunit